MNNKIIVGLIFMIFLLGSFGSVSAVTWDVQTVYDEIDDSSVNGSLWSQSTSGSGTNTITEGADYVEARAYLPTLGSTRTGQATLSSNNIKSEIKNITVQVYLSAYGSNYESDRPEAFFYVFGNLIKAVQARVSYNPDTDSSVWKVIRNESKEGNFYGIYDDGVYISEIEAANNVIYIQSITDSNAISQTQTSISRFYYVYYTYGNSSMTITQNSPTASEKIYRNENITFNITSETTINTLYNISLYIDDVINETKSITGLTNTTTFNKNLSSSSLGNHNYSTYVCDSGNNCKFSDTITFNLQPFELNSVTYNSTNYETASSTYVINLSSDSSQTITAVLKYNGTNYTATKTGDNSEMKFTSTISHANDNLGNKSLYWIINYGSTYYNSDIYYQNINALVFGLCNATNTVPYINFSFKDEDDLSLINVTIDASTWTYYLGDGTVTKELLYSNTSLNYNYVFCLNAYNETLHNTRNVQFSSEGYPQRAYDASSDLTNVTLNKTLYLLSSADGIYTTIQVIDASERVVSGVEVTVERQFSGIWTIVGQSNTDSSGSVTFWVNPDYEHRFTFVHDDCTTTTETIKPTQTNYIQTISCLGTSEETGVYASPIEGLRYSRFPASGIIAPGITNFTFTIVSTKDNIIGVKFEILNATDFTVLMQQNSTCTTSGCTIYGIYDIPEGARLRGRYFVDLGSGYFLIEGDAAWITITPYSGDHGTLKNFFLNFNRMFVVSDSPTAEDRNKQEFSKFVFIFFLFAVVYSLFNKATGYDAANPGLIIFPLAVLILMGSLAAGFDCANHGCQGMFYYYDFGGQTITEKLGRTSGFMNNYILALMSGFIGFGYFLSTMKRNL